MADTPESIIAKLNQTIADVKAYNATQTGAASSALNQGLSSALNQYQPFNNQITGAANSVANLFGFNTNANRDQAAYDKAQSTITNATNSINSLNAEIANLQRIPANMQNTPIYIASIGGKQTPAQRIATIQQAIGMYRNQISSAQPAIDAYNNAKPISSTEQLQSVFDTPQYQAIFGKQDASLPLEQRLAQTPGYQFTRDEALRAVQNQGLANGGVGGNVLKALQDRAAGLASTTYQQYVDNSNTLSNQLLALNTQGANIAGNKSNLLSNNATNQANLNMAAIGNNLAATQLGQGNYNIGGGGAGPASAYSTNIIPYMQGQTSTLNPVAGASLNQANSGYLR